MGEQASPERILSELAKQAGLSVQGSDARQLVVYCGASTLLSQFLQLVTGSSSLAKLDLQGFQLAQIRKEVKAIHANVKIINDHQCKAAVDFFLRGNYEDAHKSAMLGFRSASDIENKVTATQIKIITGILSNRLEVMNHKLREDTTGKMMKMCLDELLDDHMVRDCWNTARKKITRIVPVGHGETLRKLEHIDTLLRACYPVLSHCLGWSRAGQQLHGAGPEAGARLCTKYVPQGEAASIILGKYKEDSVRLDVCKTLENQLRVRVVSGSCFQPELTCDIKSRPEKGSEVRLARRQAVDRLEFDLESMEKGNNDMMQGIANETENKSMVGFESQTKESAGSETEQNAEEMKDSSESVASSDHSKEEPAETDEKAANLKCCFHDNCQDHNELWEEETLDRYDTIVGCNACFGDGDEDGYVYHPECFETKHRYLNNKTKDTHKSSRWILKTSDLKKLSKAERIMKLKTDKTLVLSSFTAMTTAVPNIAAGVIGVAKVVGGAGINVVDEIAAVTYGLGQEPTLALGTGLSVAALVLEVGYQAHQWSKGNISSEEFKMKGIEAVVGNLSSLACATAGTVIGTAVGGPVGAFVGGVLGAIVGLVASYCSRRVVEWAFDYDEDSKRADLIIEAFHFLDLPALHLISEGVVEQSFRKLALECHPDSVRVQARNAMGREIAKIEWQLLQHAKDVSLGYFKNKHCFSPRCKKAIQTKYDPNSRNTTTYHSLKDSLDAGAKASHENFVI